MNKQLQIEMAQLLKERGVKPIPVVLSADGPLSVSALLRLLPKRFRQEFQQVGVVWLRESHPSDQPIPPS